MALNIDMALKKSLVKFFILNQAFEKLLLVGQADYPVTLKFDCIVKLLHKQSCLGVIPRSRHTPQQQVSAVMTSYCGPLTMP